MPAAETLAAAPVLRLYLPWLRPKPFGPFAWRVRKFVKFPCIPRFCGRPAALQLFRSFHVSAPSAGRWLANELAGQMPAGIVAPRWDAAPPPQFARVEAPHAGGGDWLGEWRSG